MPNPDVSSFKALEGARQCRLTAGEDNGHHHVIDHHTFRILFGSLRFRGFLSFGMHPVLGGTQFSRPLLARIGSLPSPLSSLLLAFGLPQTPADLDTEPPLSVN